MALEILCNKPTLLILKCVLPNILTFPEHTIVIVSLKCIIKATHVATVITRDPNSIKPGTLCFLLIKGKLMVMECFEILKHFPKATFNWDGVGRLGVIKQQVLCCSKVRKKFD